MLTRRARSAIISTVISVSTRKPIQLGPRPAHHLNDTKSLFVNPWPSYQGPTIGNLFNLGWKMQTSPPQVGQDVDNLLRIQTPTWGLKDSLNSIKATWLGHACFLVELPAPKGADRGVRILFDPVFSYRCSPSSFMGPARHTKAPCEISDIPAIEAVVISHNHYDHMDVATLKQLAKLHDPHFFAPLNNDQFFGELGIAPNKFHCLDWWDDATVRINLPAPSGGSDSAPSVETAFRLTCTPCQHQSARGLFDRNATLWSSWALEDLGTPTESNPSSLRRVYFAGDSGYRTVHDGKDEETVPVCPAFKEIGEKFDGFDLALIPIGAYQPRAWMSAFHASPSDSVRIFLDVKAKRALGMHWGTWILTPEPPLEPPKLLAEAVKKAKIAADAFTVCGLGETVLVRD